MKKLCSTLVLLILFLNANAGSIQKWTDENGNVHFGDRPPPGKSQSEELKIMKPSSSAQQSIDKLKRIRKDMEKSSRVRKNKKKLAKKNKEKQKKREEYCAKEKDRLKLFQAGGRLVTMRNGERHFYTSSEIESNIKTAKGNLKKFCD